ncbi:hypothetical protein [Peterkaempfera bronchialis]|uniref:Integral membrane protein n=1 Tax=Peterkaempfera bronchialis TaxID=2126346 RepID=A0A345T033_9ACTN|nr:hypothetical protein [Peterkaempfera bronchialis]AXI79338.1 hypothetical protein C7M71_019865 [Peterkaempfera bronchialis]
MSAHRPRLPEGDPVRRLMERHRELCETATHPLEIAAGLEAAGVGPAAVARCRHADVFSLAEELYARVPRRPAALGAAGAADPWRRRAGASLLAAVLYALPCGAFAAIRAVAPQSSPLALLSAAAVAGVWYAATALETARWQGGGGRSHTGPPGPQPTLRAISAAGIGAVLVMPLVLPFAGAGDPAPPTAPAALAVGMGAAEWCARWFRHTGQVHLDTAATRREFRRRMAPVLPVAVALHLGAVALLTWAVLALLPPHGAAGSFGGPQWAAQTAAALLLVLVLLLLRCGRTGPAAAGPALAVACTGLLLAVRTLPWDLPGRALLTAYDPVAVPLVGCGAAGALLLPWAWVALTRPGAHRGAPPPPDPSPTPARSGLPARTPLTEGPTPS